MLSRSSLEAEGFDVIERRQPSLLMDGSILVTGEVDRTTDFETGMPFHEARREHGWEPEAGRAVLWANTGMKEG